MRTTGLVATLPSSRSPVVEVSAPCRRDRRRAVRPARGRPVSAGAGDAPRAGSGAGRRPGHLPPPDHARRGRRPASERARLALHGRRTRLPRPAAGPSAMAALGRRPRSTRGAGVRRMRPTDATRCCAASARSRLATASSSRFARRGSRIRKSRKPPESSRPRSVACSPARSIVWKKSWMPNGDSRVEALRYGRTCCA